MSDPTPEQWRPVTGYEDYYEVSNLGRVRSLDREVSAVGGQGEYTYIRPGRVLKLGKDKRRGVLQVGLCVESQRVSFLVHRLVAEAFLDAPPDENDAVMHIDGDGLNNRAENLRWTTHDECITAFWATSPDNNKGERNGRAKLSARQVHRIRESYAPHKVTQKMLADKYGVTECTIGEIIRGAKWAAIK